MRRRKKLDVFKLAVELAGAGDFNGWEAIRDELVRRGHEDAHDLLRDETIRATLDLHCAHAGKQR